MRWMVLTLAFLFVCNGFALESKKELLKLVNEEIKITTALKKQSLDTKYKIFQLYNEKLAIVFEIENENFLSAPPKDSMRLGKAHYFKESTDLYKKCLELYQELEKKYPRNRYIAEINYLLGLIHRDFFKLKEAEERLLLALSFSQKGSELRYNIQVSIAEFYYNEKKYEKALSFYREVIQNTQNEWLTKHLYNMAWVLLKIKSQEESLSRLLEALELSRTKKYVNISDQVISKAMIFFTLVGKVRDGILFYEKESKNLNSDLLSFAAFANEKSPETDVHEILKKSLSHAKTPNERGQSLFALLEFYGKFNRYDEHHQMAQTIQSEFIKDPIPFKDLLEPMTDNIKKVVGFYQVKVNKDALKGKLNHSPEELERIKSYFSILGKIDEKDLSRYLFLTGETHYQLTLFKEAEGFYQNSLLNLEKIKSQDIPFKKKILLSLLSIIEIGNLGTSLKESELFTYPRYIALFPKDVITPPMYHKLFTHYMQMQKSDSATNIFESYSTNFPSNLTEQKKMVMALIDETIVKKNPQALTIWIKKIKTGPWGFDEPYIEKAMSMLGKILFEGHRKEISEGKTAAAISGLLLIINDKNYPEKSIAEAHLVLSEAYAKSGQFKESLKNGVISFDLFSVQDKKTFYPVYKELIKNFHDELLLDESLTLTTKIIPLACEQKSEASLYSFYFDLLLGTNQSSKAISILKKPVGYCKISDHTRLFNYLVRHAQFDLLVEHRDLFTKTKEEQEIFASKIFIFSLNETFKSKAVPLLAQYHGTKFLEQKEKINQKKKTIHERVTLFMKRRIKELPQFDGERFSANLSFYLNELQKTKNDLLYLSRKEDESIVHLANQLIAEIYTKAGDNLLSIKVNGTPPEFADTVYAEMKKLSSGLSEVANHHRNEANKHFIGLNFPYMAHDWPILEK